MRIRTLRACGWRAGLGRALGPLDGLAAADGPALLDANGPSRLHPEQRQQHEHHERDGDAAQASEDSGPISSRADGTADSRQNAPMTSATARPAPSPWAVATALGVVYVVWGSTYLGIAVMVRTLPPLVAAGFRYALSGAILLVAIAVWRRLRGEPGLRLTPTPIPVRGHHRHPAPARRERRCRPGGAVPRVGHRGPDHRHHPHLAGAVRGAGGRVNARAGWPSPA